MSSSNSQEVLGKDERVLVTFTGEYFQPVRLHYRLYHLGRLVRSMKKLRCVEHDPPRDRLVWLYNQEASTLRFKRSYDEIPKHLHPIILGSFYVREKELLLDLRSHERACLAIPFFDRHVPRKVARLEYAEATNRLYPATQAAELPPEKIFDQPSSGPTNDPDALLRDLLEQAKQISDPVERFKRAAKQMEALARKPLPEIERMPIHYYAEGLSGFTANLTFRQIVALEHWLGNTEYTLHDAITAATKSRQGKQ